MPAGDLRGNSHCRAFAQVINIRLKREAKAGDFSSLARLLLTARQSATRAFTVDYPFWFVIVNFTRGPDKPSLLRILRHDKPRVDRDTVAANARARLKNIDPRMTIRPGRSVPRR